MRSNDDRRDAGRLPQRLGIQEARGAHGRKPSNSSVRANAERLNEFTLVTKETVDTKSGRNQGFHRKENEGQQKSSNINNESGILDGDEEDDDSAGVVTLN